METVSHKFFRWTTGSLILLIHRTCASLVVTQILPVSYWVTYTLDSYNMQVWWSLLFCQWSKGHLFFWFIQHIKVWWSHNKWTLCHTNCQLTTWSLIIWIHITCPSLEVTHILSVKCSSHSFDSYSMCKSCRFKDFASELLGHLYFGFIGHASLVVTLILSVK